VIDNVGFYSLDRGTVFVMIDPAEMIGECGQYRPGKFINQISLFFRTTESSVRFSTLERFASLYPAPFFPHSVWFQSPS
jgi:hypothetical protein